MGVASNFRRSANIKKGLRKMRQLFGDLEISHLIKSSDFSGKGAFYWNLVVKFKSGSSVAELKTLMKDIEASCGRLKKSKELGRVSLDLDFLLLENVNSAGFCLLDSELSCNLSELYGLGDLLTSLELQSAGLQLDHLITEFDYERFRLINVKWDSVL